MGSFKDFDKKAPPPGAQPDQAGAQPDQRKNDEETGEPVQLPGEAEKQGKAKSGKRRQGGHEEPATR
jgi:hypothetical protein